MKQLMILLIGLMVFGCTDKPDIDKNDGTADREPGQPITTELRTFIFGHSIINHELQVNITPSNETSMPHWLYLLSEDVGYDFSATGQYGFLPQHTDLPPESQWWFDLFTSPWDSEGGQSFADVDFNTVLLTPANFIQWQSSLDNYYQEDFSPVDATVEIFDWVSQQEPGITLYIYEGWPDMANFIESFPPTDQELANYHAYSVGDFHLWWLEYHDEVMRLRPDLNVKMIPVGSVLTRVLTETNLRNIDVLEIYEDDAPHGRATTYFLTSLIAYMAMYGVETPTDFQAPEIIHSSVNENYEDISRIIWEELNAFRDGEGNSRVW